MKRKSKQRRYNPYAVIREVPAAPSPAVVRSQIEAIALEQLGLETLELRNRDSLDFHDLSVSAIRRALEVAFAAGAASVRS